MTHNNNNDDAQAGARVVVPRGSFKTGSVMLRSNLDLHLEAGAGLYGSDDWSEYPVVAGLPFGTMFRKESSRANRRLIVQHIASLATIALILLSFGAGAF